MHLPWEILFHQTRARSGRFPEMLDGCDQAIGSNSDNADALTGISLDLVISADTPWRIFYLNRRAVNESQ